MFSGKKLLNSHMSCVSCCLAIALSSMMSLSAHAEDLPQMDLPRTQLTAGFYQIDAQVARSAEERETGLMFRKNMPQNEGMLFVFERPATQCFWMKNTLIPLSIAFINDQGEVVNTDEMKAQTETSHCSKEPVRYVLEMNKGWFSQRGIKSGFKFTGAPTANVGTHPDSGSQPSSRIQNE